MATWYYLACLSRTGRRVWYACSAEAAATWCALGRPVLLAGCPPELAELPAPSDVAAWLPLVA
jgi:hypothetical protein